MAEEKDKKPLGPAEVIAGAAAGITTAEIAAATVNANAAIQRMEQAAQKIIEADNNRNIEINIPDYIGAELGIHPGSPISPNDPRLEHWGLRENPGVVALKERVRETKEAVEAAVAPIVKELEENSGLLKGPITAFKNASNAARVGMGAAIAAATVGTAYLVNKFRNRKPKAGVADEIISR